MVAGLEGLDAIGTTLSSAWTNIGPMIWLLAGLLILFIFGVILLVAHLKGYLPTSKYPNFAGIFELVGNSVMLRVDSARRMKDNQGMEEYEIKSNKERTQKFSYSQMIPMTNGKKAILMFKPSDNEAYPVKIELGDEEEQVPVLDERGNAARDEKGNIVYQLVKHKILALKPLLTGSDVNAYIDRLRRNQERLRKKGDLEKYYGVIAMVILGVFLLLFLAAILWRMDVLATTSSNGVQAAEYYYKLELLRHGGNGTVIGG